MYRSNEPRSAPAVARALGVGLVGALLLVGGPGSALAQGGRFQCLDVPDERMEYRVVGGGVRRPPRRLAGRCRCSTATVGISAAGP